MNSWVYNGFVIKSELLTETIRFYRIMWSSRVYNTYDIMSWIRSRVEIPVSYQFFYGEFYGTRF